jgi:hypothetical protein
MVTAIWAWRRICMTSRGCTSKSTNRVAQVRRPSCTVIFRTAAFAHRVSQARLKLRGSIGVPHLVVKISLPPCHADPATSLAWASSTFRSRSAAAQTSGSGNVASELAVLVSRCSNSCRHGHNLVRVHGHAVVAGDAVDLGPQLKAPNSPSKRRRATRSAGPPPASRCARHAGRPRFAYGCLRLRPPRP